MDFFLCRQDENEGRWIGEIEWHLRSSAVLAYLLQVQEAVRWEGRRSNSKRVQGLRDAED